METQNNYYVLKNFGAQIVKFNENMQEHYLNNMYCIALFIGFPNKFIYIPITIFDKDNNHPIINSKITKDSKNSELYDIISESNNESNIICNLINTTLLSGKTNDFIKDKDFFLSKSIVDRIKNNEYKDVQLNNDYFLPNYWRSSNEINSDYFENITDFLSINNIEWCNFQNCLTLSSLSEDDINNCRVTFTKTLLELFNNNENKLSNKDNINHNFAKYKIALNYYANTDINTDETYLKLQQVLSNFNYSNTNTSSCSTYNQTNSPFITNQPADCLSQYKNGMQSIIVEMFSNIDFYCQLFYNNDNIQNSELCDHLINLINGILDKINLSSNTNNHCNCPAIDFNSNSQCSDKTTLENFKQVLLWIENNELNNHINQIKTYGHEFGKLFPSLMF